MAFGPIAQMIGGAIVPTVVFVAVAGGKWRRSTSAGDESQPTTDDSGLEILNRRALREFLEVGGDPRRVSLRCAQLNGVDLSDRNMQRVDLSRSELRKSILAHTCLARARLDFADLSGADLQHADLAGASLVNTNLWRADLRGANLSTCGTAGSANLRRALYDKTTRWPPGFDPTMAGAHQRDDVEGVLQGRGFDSLRHPLAPVLYCGREFGLRSTLERRNGDPRRCETLAAVLGTGSRSGGAR